jgi:Na+-translocating ferredoxin:NAD+ oxidoreductase subunit C
MRLRPAFPGGILLPQSPLPRQAGGGRVWQMPFAPLLQLPLRQGACAPAVAVVREGEEVVRGQLLARADGEDSVALHAPATGTVRAIVEQADPAIGAAGGTVGVIQLAPSPGDTQEPLCGHGVDPASASAETVLAAIAASGLVGDDGEARPTHARVRAAAGRGAEWLVLNGIEAEPGFGRVRAMLQSQAGDVLFGLRCVLKATGIARAVLAVERQDNEVAQALASAAPAGLELSLRVLPPRYPQGAEALLLRALELPGALCLDVVTVAELGRLLAGGLGMTDQVVTLAGGALREPGNYRVPLGTPLGFALAHAGLAPDVARVLQGGPMRGETLASLDGPVTKGATGFMALDPAEVGASAGVPAPPMPCIRCGDCLAVCPLQLNPAQLGLLARKGDIKVMHEEYYLDHCIECGCCAYVCPSRIPLVEQFRAAKAQWRRRERSAAVEDAA